MSSEESGEESESDNSFIEHDDGSESSDAVVEEDDSDYDGDELERMEAQLDRRPRARRRRIRNDSSDEEQEERRRRRRRRDESSEEEEEEEEQDYPFIDKNSGRLLYDPGWREMYDYFEAGGQEPPGYEDHWEYHIPPTLSADQLWQQIRIKTTQPGFYAKYGVRAERRTINGNQVTILHRTTNGTQYKWNDKLKAGNYNKILLDIVPLLLPQKPFQPPFVPEDTWRPKPRFLDYKPDSHINVSYPNMENALNGTSLWCLCAMSSLKPKNPLQNLTAMKHTKNGLILMVGGMCAAHIMGYQYLDTVTFDDLNDEVDAIGIAQYLGVAGDDD